MKLELINHSDPILHMKTEPFSFENPPHDPGELVESMNTLMEEKNGLGLAAPQVGIPFSMFLMRGPLAVFNPVLVGVSDELIELEEGCLSYKNLIVSVNRPRHLKIRYQDHKGETHTNTYTNMTARIVQHEMSHLEGKQFFEGISRVKMNRAIKKAKKLGTNYEGEGLLKFCL